jgi:HEAT repeat protein
MKRLLAIAIVMLSAAVAGFADETTEVYQMLFRQAEGLPQKYAAALNLVGLNDKATAPILAQALQDLLLKQQSYSSPDDQELYGRTVRILAQALGEYKDEDAAPFLWQAAQQVPDPLARAEAIMALGKMRALDYVERIALMLRDLNFQPTQDRDAGEKLAYACVVALEKFKDSRGFSPVFFATDAWYSLRVRQEAEAALPGIADDPTDPIKAIIGVEVPDRDLRALRAEADSKAPDQRKIETAVLALGIGLQKAPRDKDEAKLYSDLRKYALRVLIAYKAGGPDSVDGCVASYQRGFDDEERLLALSALGVNGSDPAAAALRDIIVKLDNDRKAGISDETSERMAKAAIENCAVAKNKITRPALLAVTFDDNWSGGIILAAQTALKAMQ